SPRDVLPHDLDTGDLARPDRGVQPLDRRLFDAKRHRTSLFGHSTSPVNPEPRISSAASTMRARSPPAGVSLKSDSLRRIDCGVLSKTVVSAVLSISSPARYRREATGISLC